MKKPKTSIRSVQCELHIREAEGGESRVIEGCAIVFNQPSVLLDDWGEKFTEYIEPTCVTQDWLATQDVKLNLLHDRSLTIARCNKGKGNLALEVREDGVHFSFEAPKCDIGDQALELVRGGVYSGCSFEFTPNDYTIDDAAGVTTIRHKSFGELHALTIGMDPAYTQTTVNCREELAKCKKKAEECDGEDDGEKPDSEKHDGEAEKREAIRKARRRRIVAECTRMIINH